MDFGVCYYPEHWPESRWEEDILLMKKLHFTVIRIAEFAWSRLEPRENEYDFTWVDCFLDLCRQHQMKVMLGVPVRNVPAWLINKHPSVSICAQGGYRESFGSRYTTCIQHPALQIQALKLSEQMALKYKDNPTVYSWHLDNEFGDASTCFCEVCRQAFIEWLKQKYGTIDAVNQIWGLVFWSLEINDWDEIWLPAEINHFPHNPGLLQDYKRFTSWKTEQFVKKQALLFRQLAPGQPITSNLQSMTREHTDYHELSRHLDVVSVNYYPPFSYTEADLDLMRSFKNQPFWVVEQKSGAPGFSYNGHLTPAPGETRMHTYQSLAHGAESIFYFRWRVLHYGQEQLHKGILDYDGRTNRIYEEIERTGREIHGIYEKVRNTKVRSEVALLMSYDTRWALQDFYPHPDIPFKEFFIQYYRAIKKYHVNVDIRHPNDDLSSYKLVVVPLLYMMDESMSDRLADYVRNGGTLVYTFRSGAKDENSSMTQSVLPERMLEVLGIRVKESIALPPDKDNRLEMRDGSSYTASKWCDLVEIGTADALGHYTDDWFSSETAVSMNQFGKGKAYYVGTWTGDVFVKKLLRKAAAEAGIQPLLEGAEEVETISRTNDTESYLFLLNRSMKKQSVYLKGCYRDIMEGHTHSGQIILEPYGVKVLCK